ncbi:MAG: ABC transporter ATP-binding protein, partial [Bacteroidales bacterium]|nr:ABC transporter ATP-binding protein [Bacteroidales bacterium]
DLLIADEPTTALDVTVQSAIIDLLKQVQKRRHLGIVFISHDLGVMAQVADSVAVMYRGKLVEQGATDDILHRPGHPYTKGLIACRPPLEGRPRRLPTVADFMEQDRLGTPSDAQQGETEKGKREEERERKPLLSVRNLEVTYTLRKNLFGKATRTLKGVDAMSFDILEGETLGLVGESGCGKTTLGRALLRLIDASAGTITYRGRRLDTLGQGQMKELRTKMQIIFQDPYSSLNPRITIGEAILEPLQTHGIYGNPAERRDAVLELMRQVGLQPDWYGRYPHEFSGGQRQRACIARALILQPELVVCDESVSALDVSVQAQVLNLLNDLKRQYGYTYLFISHDLGVVRYISDRIIVMRQGRMVEMGTADDVFRWPQQEYTRALISAIPRL